MSDQSRQQLKRAYEMIKAGQKKEASQLLVDMLKADRNNADAWWLLANATPKKENAQQALEQVLRLRPNDENARKLLAKLQGQASPPPASSGFSAPPISSGDRFSMSGSASESPRWSQSSQGMFGGPEPDDPFGSPVSGTKGQPITDDDLFASYSPKQPGAKSDPYGGSSSKADPLMDDPFADDPFADDPFNAPAKPAPIMDDPFADDPFSAPKSSSRAASDPFASSKGGASDPFGSSAKSSSRSTDPFGNDPFAAAPKSRSQNQTADDPFGSGGDGDPFADDPFAGVGAGKKGGSKRSPSSRSSSSGGGNPVVIILAVVGVVALLGCGICGWWIYSTGNQMVQIVTENMTIMPDGTVVFGGSFGSSSGGTLPTNLEMQGGISAGQTLRGNLDGIRDDGWPLQGSAGQTITIELNAVTTDLDPRVYIYNPDGTLLGENDDIDLSTNRNSRLTVTLPSNGTYTIVASQFGFSAGDYELRVMP